MNEIKITFQSVCQLIQEKQLNMAENYVAIGYYLRKAREAELYKDGGYASIHEMASSEFGMARQTADHCMKINEKFSEGGDSPALEESFRKYGKSQLQEMLYLTDEQMESVRPDMTVKDIRNIRKPVENPVKVPVTKPELKKGRKPTEEEREILDELARKLIRVYKVWMSADFHTRVMDVMTSYQALREQMGKSGSYSIWFSGRAGTYHANLFEEYVQLWEDHDGCLGNIETFYLAAAIQAIWNEIALEDARKKVEQTRGELENIKKKMQQAKVELGECSTSSKEPEEHPEEQNPGQDSIEEHPEWLPEDYEKQKPPIIEGECREVQQEEETEECSTSSMAEEEELSDLDILKDRLEREKRLLGIALKELGDEDRHTRQQKLIVSALAAAVCDLENENVPEEESIQPELPALKNNDQRKDWLRTYKDWGLWYRDENIGVEYYKYDFSNGARLIAEVYVRPGYGRCPVPSETAYLHLVGGPDPKKGSDGIEKWQKHEHYSKHPNSNTELVEFLKELQK